MRLTADKKDREASHEAMDLAELRLHPKSRIVPHLNENTHKFITKWKKKKRNQKANAMVTKAWFPAQSG